MTVIAAAIWHSYLLAAVSSHNIVKLSRNKAVEFLMIYVTSMIVNYLGR